MLAVEAFVTGVRGVSDSPITGLSIIPGLLELDYWTDLFCALKMIFTAYKKIFILLLHAGDF